MKYIEIDENGNMIGKSPFKQIGYVNIPENIEWQLDYKPQEIRTKSEELKRLLTIEDME